MLLTRDGAVLLAATFCYLASTMLANPLVVGFAGTLGATAAMMGVLTALMNACSLVVRPVAGNLSDRLPKRRLALAGAALMLVTALGQALAPSTALLAVMRLANGAGYSLCSVCMSTWFAETLPPARLGQGMGVFGLMNALGMAVARRSESPSPTRWATVPRSASPPSSPRSRSQASSSSVTGEPRGSDGALRARRTGAPGSACSTDVRFRRPSWWRSSQSRTWPPSRSS